VLPLRYAYAGSAAYAHDRLARSNGYRSVVGWAELVVRATECDGMAAAALSRMVDIGPGNGVRTVVLLRALADHGPRGRSYLGLDFSATLLGMACDRIRDSLGGTVSLQSGVWDLEAGRSARIDRWRCGLGRDGPVVAFMLGHTLGNVDSAEQVLGHVHGSLRPGDTLVAGVTLQPPDADHSAMLEPYRTDAFVKAALEPLRAVGVALDDIEFGVRFTDGAVVGEAVFRRKVRLGFSTVQAGHVLRCFRSRRFAMSDVMSMLERTGFRTRAVIVDERREQAVVIAG